MAGIQPLPRASRVQVIGSSTYGGPAHHAPPPHAANSDALFGFTLKWDLYQRALQTVTDSLPGFAAGITVTVKGGPDADIRRVWYLALSAALGRYRNRVRGKANTIEFAGAWDVTGKACQVEIAYTSNNIEQFVASTLEGVASDVVELVTAIPDRVARLFGVITNIGTQRFGGTPASFVQRGPEQLTVGGPLPRWLRNTSQRLPEPSGDTVSWEGHACFNVSLRPGGAPWKQWLSGPGRVYRSADIWREFPTSFVLGRGLFSDIALAGTFPYSVDAMLSPKATGGDADPIIPPKNPRVRIQKTGDIVLPDDGRVITTGEKGDPRVQCPQPLVDGLSRGSLLALVAQSLQNPCFLPTSPPCTRQLTHPGTGVYAYPPGRKSDTFENADDMNILVAAINAHPIARTLPAVHAPGPSVTPDGYIHNAVVDVVQPNVKG